ncbi:hypothetical protein sos41_04180 [Alphaproteobacteria bacterium SO-S41]|nr:hypothetical protein sos41_04180 [Alphaproteobacteria bacterium SO-S41]
MRIAVPALALLSAVPASAAGVTVSVEIPKLDVAEYHKPYLAIWIEKSDQSVAANLAVWYGTKLKENEGEKWLKDLRQWWRRAGRDLKMPIDGVSGPTRAPGTETVTATPTLEPGSYSLVVEAARESGGREVVKVPFTWPAEAATSASGAGTSELGAIKLDIQP